MRSAFVSCREGVTNEPQLGQSAPAHADGAGARHAVTFAHTLHTAADSLEIIKVGVILGVILQNSKMFKCKCSTVHRK